MKFFHGTNQIINNIDLSKGKLRTDFGLGFYIGNNLGEARKWAVKQSTPRQTPTVMGYVLSRLIFDPSHLDISRKIFKEPSEEWLEFVKENRRRSSPNSLKVEPRHLYDIVYGPIADDKVADVVEYYIDGKITISEAVKRAKTIKSITQFSFHTPLSLQYIEQTQTMYQQLMKNGNWSDWRALTV